MKRIILAASVAAMALAGTAYAAVEGAGPMGKTVTRAEAQTMAGTMFDKMDANKDGKLDKADREARMLDRFKTMDTDGNGQLSQGEFLAAHNRDKGAKGLGGMEGMKAEGKMGGMRHGKHRGMGGGHMMMADVNKDGAITRAEFLAAHLKHFDMADANKDGSVTPEERKAAMAKMRGMMGGKNAGGMGGMDMPPPPAN